MTLRNKTTSAIRHILAVLWVVLIARFHCISMCNLYSCVCKSFCNFIIWKAPLTSYWLFGYLLEISMFRPTLICSPMVLLSPIGSSYQSVHRLDTQRCRRCEWYKARGTSWHLSSSSDPLGYWPDPSSVYTGADQLSLLSVHDLLTGKNVFYCYSIFWNCVPLTFHLQYIRVPSNRLLPHEGQAVTPWKVSTNPLFGGSIAFRYSKSSLQSYNINLLYSKVAY